MDGVKLMNRTDTKFIFNINQFAMIMKGLEKDYRILEMKGKRQSHYETLYYDTGKFNLYIQHQNGKLNRYKIRHRTYVDSDNGYLEVKFKTNKGRTIKTRISKHDPPFVWDEDSSTFLINSLPFDPATLVPVIWVNYTRQTLVNKTGAERLTLDLNLEFVKDKTKKKLDCLVIAEVKQEKRKPSPFMKVMKKFHIRKGSLSKYCMGMALTTSDVKQNNFKPKLRTLKNKMYANYPTNC